MLLYKSRDGKQVTVVIKDREETLTMEEWSALIARPATRNTQVALREVKP